MKEIKNGPLWLNLIAPLTVLVLGPILFALVRFIARDYLSKETVRFILFYLPIFIFASIRIASLLASKIFDNVLFDAASRFLVSVAAAYFFFISWL